MASKISSVSLLTGNMPKKVGGIVTLNGIATWYSHSCCVGIVISECLSCTLSGAVPRTRYCEHCLTIAEERCLKDPSSVQGILVCEYRLTYLIKGLIIFLSQIKNHFRVPF